MNHEGAKFLKSDFQIHSPRDRGWDGSRPEDGVKEATPENIAVARANWAKDFIIACQNCDLGAIALTDHHEGVYQWHVIDEIKRAAKTDRPIDLWVFPAMELTAKDSAQAIILFDSNLPPNLFEKARNLLNLPADCDIPNKRGIEVELLDFNIDELQERLQADSELQDRFIILPNVTPEGHKTVLRKGFHRRFHDMPYVGGYLDKTYPTELKDGDRRILEGEIPDWTSEKRGVISTSDSRHADYRSLGDHCTWIKLAEPTAESIRQAMLAADSRIRYEKPDEPNVFIKSVRVEGAEFLSISEIHLSPQYNAIIGGRGAGKSTLLEYIRYAVGRSAVDLEASEWDPTFERRKSLIEDSLNETSGSVKIDVSLDGAIVSFKRTRENQHQIELLVEGETKFLSPSEVRDLVHLQIYSQGELSHLGRDQAEQRLLELITDPKRDDFERLEHQLDELANEIVRELGRMVDLWRYEQRLRQIGSEIRLLDARIGAIKTSLEEAPQKAQAVIEEQSQFLRTDRFLQKLKSMTDESKKSFTDTLETITSGIQSTLTENQDIELDDAKNAANIVTLALTQLSELQSQAQELFNETSAQLNAGISSWEPKKEAHDEEYQAVIQKLAGKEEKTKQILELEAGQQKFKEDQSTVEREINQLKDCIDNFHKRSTDYSSLQLEVINLTEVSLSEVEQLSKGLARAMLAATLETSEIEAAIDDLCASTGIRTARKTNLLEKLKKHDDPLKFWWEVIAEVLLLLKWHHNGDGAIDQLPTTPILNSEFEKSGVQKITELLTQERVNSLIRAKARPRPSILQLRGENEVAFLKASQGERATTILTILMEQSSGPLLIDQPEEDLDNNVINDIVKATRRAKDKRQLIFATHNANLVVNGDAEFVLDLLAGEVSSKGAIDSKLVRESITKTMEGGKVAFELRRKKYNF